MSRLDGGTGDAGAPEDGGGTDAVGEAAAVDTGMAADAAVHMPVDDPDIADTRLLEAGWLRRL